MNMFSRAFKPAALIAGSALMIALLGCQQSAMSAETALALPRPAVDVPGGASRSATAVFAGGCFWGVQGVFQHVRGVSNAVSGYAGGAQSSANYDQVSSGATAHAEALKITYDPSQVSYGTLLQIFFSVAHDPTELNRQGPDQGTQYRSAIFPQDAAQRQVAQAYIAQLESARVFKQPIVTKLESGHVFYPAEAYHQDYLYRNPTAPYIVIHDLPKVDNLKRMLPQLYRADAVLTR